MFYLFDWVHIKHVWACCRVPYVSLFKWNYMHMCMSRWTLCLSKPLVHWLQSLTAVSLCPCFQWQGGSLCHIIVMPQCSDTSLLAQLCTLRLGRSPQRRKAFQRLKKKKKEECLFSHQTWEMLNVHLQLCMCEFAWLNVCALSCIIPPVFWHSCLRSSLLTVG